jgi:glycosyltransferase involved in cell wall biosynthesis
LEEVVKMIAKIAKLIKKMIDGNSLSAYVIFRDPPVIISYFEDFQKNRDDILKVFKGRKFHALFQFGWHRETKERAEEVRAEAEAVKKISPGAEMIFLCNSEHEKNLIAATGLRAEFCHQNAFLDERRYAALTVTKKYDAVYVARITPFKRHHLAARINSLLLIGDHTLKEEAHFREIMRVLPNATWKRKVFSNFISKNVCQASCGLCLSAEEGAMFVSAEYLLSGIPAVSTANIGGRDVLFDKAYVYSAADTPESVLQGVEAMKKIKMSPAEIRNATLEKFRPHREKMIEILQEICDRAGVKHDVRAEWGGFFVHKFGLRCFNGPIVRMTRILKRA